MTKSMAWIAVGAALAVAVAGCGSSKKSTSTSASSASTATTASSTKPAGTALAVRKVSFGTVLVGPNGHTVYLFEKDKGTKSACTGACTGEWSPLTTSGTPQPPSGGSASMVGTTMRPDGTTQVTYGGHPLYFYADDKRPGQTEGEAKNEFGAEWYAVGVSGKKVEQAGS